MPRATAYADTRAPVRNPVQVFEAFMARLDREAEKGPVELDGIPIPAGTTVAPYIYGTHRNPDLWPSPETFDSSRFEASRAGPRWSWPGPGAPSTPRLAR